MKRLVYTVLKPSDFGNWFWRESSDNSDGEPIRAETEEECFAIYEGILQDGQISYEITNEISGNIEDERGRVYKLEYDGDGGPNYNMVWVEDVIE